MLVHELLIAKPDLRLSKVIKRPSRFDGLIARLVAVWILNPQGNRFLAAHVWRFCAGDPALTPS
jgi:hypothetical protein